MPNWCKNYITFSGDKENLEKVHQTFIQMQKDEDETNEGQKPDFLKEIKDGYFFGIWVDTDPRFPSYQYDTRWSPNVLDVQAIAEHYNVSFVLEYEELGNNIFGKTEYNHLTKKLIEKNLSDDDFAEIEFDFDNDVYTFRGETDETERNFLEQLYRERFTESY